MKSLIHATIRLLFLSILLSSCCGIYLPYPKCTGRRPPVITTYNSCVIDYCPYDCSEKKECKGCQNSGRCTRCEGAGSCSSCNEYSCKECRSCMGDRKCGECMGSGHCILCKGLSHEDSCTLCHGTGDCFSCGRSSHETCDSCRSKGGLCNEHYKKTHCQSCAATVCLSCASSGCLSCGTAGCDLCGATSCPQCGDQGCKDCENGDFPGSYYNPYVPWDTDYRAQIGDVLEISVFGDDDTLVDNVVVAPDGFIYYTLLTGIKVKDRTLKEIREELVEKLKAYFIEPIVVVNPQVVTRRNFKVLGRVTNPGLFPLSAPITIRQAIAQAGGIATENYSDKRSDARLFSLADLEKSFIARDGKILSVDFRTILQTSSERGNIYLRPGDYIFIYPAENKHVYVLGAVRAPQRVRYDDNLTLSEALANAGGWRLGYNAFSGDINHVLVVRGSLKCPCYIELDYMKILRGEARDIYLKPGDIIYVQNKKFRTGRELVDLAIRTFIFSFNTASAGWWADEWFSN